ncbi:hypothetical protein BKA70DRAFT_1339267 [Coprinopsis sp. MPI-PUGE-AT-0042]|nr:hypothetical protein BKA70DRAFT_1339267 [Coprinopsis sp. MPI-PUGE-AT-0042]
MARSKRKASAPPQWTYTSNSIPANDNRNFAAARDCVIASVYKIGTDEPNHPIVDHVLQKTRYSLMTVDLYIEIRALFDAAHEFYSLKDQGDFTDEFTKEDSDHYDAVVDVVPNLHELLFDMCVKDPSAYQLFCREVVNASSKNKANDVKTGKRNVLEWSLVDRTKPITPALLSTDRKSMRGLAHPHTGGLLLSLDLQTRWKDASTRHGRIEYSLNNPPAFLYPFNREYDAQKTVLDGLFRGETPLRCLRAILSGPATANEGPPKSIKESKASLAGRTVVQVSDYAYAVAITCFSLSSAESFTAEVECNGIHLQSLYKWTVTLLSQDNKWAKDTMAFIQAAVPLSQKPKNRKKRRIDPERADPVTAANELIALLAVGEDGRDAPREPPQQTQAPAAGGSEPEDEDDDDDVVQPRRRKTPASSSSTRRIHDDDDDDDDDDDRRRNGNTPSTSRAPSPASQHPVSRVRTRSGKV